MSEFAPTLIDLDADDRRERPATRLCYLALKEALLAGVREIRMPEPDQDGGLVEYFQAGAWKPVMKIPRQARQPLIAQYKTMAGLAADGSTESQGHMRVKLSDRLYSIVMTERATTSGPPELRLAISPAT